MSESTPSQHRAPRSSELEGLDPVALLAEAGSDTGSRRDAWTPPSPDELSGEIPGYEVFSLLGRGGMGSVYSGRQVSLDRPVAIKLLPRELSANPEFEERFRREAMAMGRLNHPNIVQIYDFGVTKSGLHYLTMERVEGAVLHQLIREGRLSPGEALNAVSQICDALQYAHGMGFVHRDIKPANIFLNQEGILKVGDFGLAKLVNPGGMTEADDLTMTDVAVGTFHYIAPEQLEGRATDHRADLYSLGVMFYEMLTNELPRGAVKEPSKRVSALDVRVDGVVFKAMEPDPADRYQSAALMRSDVDEIRVSSETPLISRSNQTTALSRGMFAALIVAGLILVLAVIFMVTWYIGRDDSESRPLRRLLHDPSAETRGLGPILVDGNRPPVPGFKDSLKYADAPRFPGRVSDFYLL